MHGTKEWQTLNNDRYPYHSPSLDTCWTRSQSKPADLDNYWHRLPKSYCDWANTALDLQNACPSRGQSNTTTLCACFNTAVDVTIVLNFVIATCMISTFIFFPSLTFLGYNLGCYWVCIPVSFLTKKNPTHYTFRLPESCIKHALRLIGQVYPPSASDVQSL